MGSGSGGGLSSGGSGGGTIGSNGTDIDITPRRLKKMQGVLAGSGRSKASIGGQWNPFSGLIEPMSGPDAQVVAGKPRVPIDKRFAILR